MSSENQRRRLGRGLSALLGEAEPEERGAGEAVHVLPVAYLRPGVHQPRHRFDKDDLDALSESIREMGVLQPILVRPLADADEEYEIIAGERRWRAAQLAELHEVPVIVRAFSNSEALEVALVENIQREDLSPIEEAEGYRRLVDEFGHTQEALASIVGRSRSHVANLLRLLGLPDSVKQMLDERLLSMGHGRAILAASDPEALAKQVTRRGLNVRQTERLASGKAKRPPPVPRAPLEKDADTIALERDLSSVLGLKVSINHSGESGQLIIAYSTLEQLDEVLRRLAHTE